MVSIAASLYLPSHISTIGRRAYYYALGDVEHGYSLLGSNSADVVKERARESVSSIATNIVEKSAEVVQGLSTAAVSASRGAEDVRRG